MYRDLLERCWGRGETRPPTIMSKQKLSFWFYAQTAEKKRERRNPPSKNHEWKSYKNHRKQRCNLTGVCVGTLTAQKRKKKNESTKVIRNKRPWFDLVRVCGTCHSISKTPSMFFKNQKTNTTNKGHDLTWSEPMCVECSFVRSRRRQVWRLRDPLDVLQNRMSSCFSKQNV